MSACCAKIKVSKKKKSRGKAICRSGCLCFQSTKKKKEKVVGISMQCYANTRIEKDKYLQPLKLYTLAQKLMYE